MTPRWWAAAVVAPVFLYGLGTTLARAGPLPPLALAAVGLTALPVAAAVRPRWLLPLVGPSAFVAVVVSLDAWLTGTVPTGVVGDLGVGLLVGLPLWFAGTIAGTIERFGLSLLLLVAGLADLVMTRAAVETLAAPFASSAFLPAWYSVDNAQLHAIAAALGNGLGPSPPLQGILDPALVGLALLAVAGLLVPMLRSPERDLALPRPPRRRAIVPASRTVPPPVLAVREGTPTPAAASPGAGFLPVAGAATALALVVVVAGATAAYTYLAVSLGVGVVLLALTAAARPVEGRRAAAEQVKPR